MSSLCLERLKKEVINHSLGKDDLERWHVEALHRKRDIYVDSHRISFSKGLDLISQNESYLEPVTPRDVMSVSFKDLAQAFFSVYDYVGICCKEDVLFHIAGKCMSARRIRSRRLL